MKNLLLITGLFCFTILHAQDTLELTISNPSPRVGDEVELSIPFEFFAEYVESTLNESIKTPNDEFFGNEIEVFSRTIVFSKVGKNTVGPFEFDFNGKKIITDSIVVNVTEKLPFEAGVWIRVTQDQEGNKYLIIEQLIDNQGDKMKSEDVVTFTAGGELNEKQIFTELEETYFDGIRFVFKRSLSNTRNKEGEALFTPGLTYSFKKYEINFQESFVGPFILTKKHLNNVPKKFKFDEIEITL